MEKLSKQDSLARRAMEQIRSEITSGRLEPGTMVSAVQLAERIGVSRTPIRDALLQLEQAGMVRIEKNRGATILATTLEDLLEVFQLRLMLEVPAAGQAARTRTDEQLRGILACFEAMGEATDDAEELLVLDRDLHISIAAASGNGRLQGLLLDLRNLVLTRGVGTTSTARTGRELVDDHAGLVDAIERQDAETASAEMRRHIKNTAQLLIAQEAGGDPERGPEWVAEQLAWL
ncbi:GntR family transcriptional regulator [Leucobacter sp. NPDC015123]|uniref:GntR family transcriptional regulator n=1 Tax=Leucobacter sp. NPDC015123 TaxID=3364129 RepID=UPI0036F4AE82